MKRLAHILGGTAVAMMARAPEPAEVYVSGLAGAAPQEYVMVPGGEGRAYGYQGNPGLYVGDIGKTRTEGAYSRRGDVTVYEWAIGLCVGSAVRLIRRSGRGRGDEASEFGDLDERLASIERRLTDTQEVMLALSERYDQLEGHKSVEPGRDSEE